MQNKIFTLILAIIVVVFLGLTFMGKKGAPDMSRVLKSQENTAEILSRLENKIEGQTVTKQDLTNIYNTLNDLSRRLTTLEVKVNSGALGAGGNARPQPPQPPQEDYAKEYDIPVGKSYVRGNKNAPVTIVEFVDMQCPFCAKFHPMVNQVLETFPDKVNYVLKNFPLSFHPEARPAAKAALAAGEQGKYWEMVELILADNSKLSTDLYKQYAKDLGLNVDKFLKDLEENDAQWEQMIQDDMKLGATVEVRGTPTFFLDSRKTRARDFPSLKREIETILKGK